MNKVRTLAITLMALTLFACKKQEPKQTEDAVLSLRIDDAELRAIEGQINAGTTTEITSNVTISLNNGAGRTYTLTPDQIAAAKTAQGCRLEVSEVVTSVTLTANAEVTDATNIADWQGKGGNAFKTKIPLTATTNAITTSTEGTKTVYKAELTPVPPFARLEVFGKITPAKTSTNKCAFESIEVKEVTINNYLETRNAATRYFTDHNTTLNGFANTPARKAEMMDAITDKTAFEAGTKAAAYQLFPKKTTGEKADVSDHVILKLAIKYSTDAIAKGFPAGEQIRYVTIKKFKTDAKVSGKPPVNVPALRFNVGTIYKLDLKGLNDHFKTNEDGTPDPSNPDTTEPESKGKKELQLIVKPCTWTSQNILPEL